MTCLLRTEPDSPAGGLEFDMILPVMVLLFLHLELRKFHRSIILFEEVGVIFHFALFFPKTHVPDHPPASLKLCGRSPKQTRVDSHSPKAIRAAG